MGGELSEDRAVTTIGLPDFYEAHARAFLEETHAVRRALQLEINGPDRSAEARLAPTARDLAALEHAIARVLGTTPEPK